MKRNTCTAINTKRVLIDFDRTIHGYSKGWYNGNIYDIPINRAKESIDELKERGYQIVIWSSRVSQTMDNRVEQAQLIEKWLNRHNIWYDLITADKLPAEYYIDDRAIHIDGDWNAVMAEIELREETSVPLSEIASSKFTHCQKCGEEFPESKRCNKCA